MDIEKIWGWCPFAKKHTWLYYTKCPLTGADMWVSQFDVQYLIAWKQKRTA